MKNLQSLQTKSHLCTGVRTTIITTLAFVVCTVPITVCALSRPKSSSDWIRYSDWSLFIFNSSSAVSAVVYSCTDKRFKNRLRLVFHCAADAPRSRKVSPGIWTVVSDNWCSDCSPVSDLHLHYLLLFVSDTICLSCSMNVVNFYVINYTEGSLVWRISPHFLLSTAMSLARLSLSNVETSKSINQSV